MTTLRQAARQALEALEERYVGALRDRAIDALEAALAEPEQEPVAWMFQHEETGRTMCVDAQQVEWGFEKGNPRLKKIAPLYTAPTPRRPLTDEEMRECAQAMDAEPLAEGWPELIKFARAIERHHGIRE
jgi:hypothetical protein